MSKSQHASANQACGNPDLSAHSPLSAVLATCAVAVASWLLMALSGCASFSGIASGAQPLAASDLGVNQSGISAAPAPPSALQPDWWLAFADPALNDLVQRALVGNPSLKVAAARLARAEAAAGAVQASSGPQVSGAFDLTRQRFSGTSIYPTPLGGSVRTLSSAQAIASWEIDLFGRNRAAIEAAVGAQRAAQADADAARILLATNLVRAYVQLARLLEQRSVAEQALAQRTEALVLIRRRVDSGLDTAVELRQGQGSLPESRQQIEALAEQIMLARHALAALSVQAPGALNALNPALRSVPGSGLPFDLPAELPADLLGRRADIAAARWRIEAATSDMKSAKAQFYPNINLTAFVGLASIGLDQLIKSSSEQYGVGPAIRLPVFDSGRLRANLRVKAADLDAAVESYNLALIDAVHEAADQIASIKSIALQQREQAQAQEAAESTYDLAKQRYQAGLSTYLTVLNAEAFVLGQRRLATDLKARALDSQVQLVRALGGGYAPR